MFPPPEAAERLLRGDASLLKRLGAHKRARLVKVDAKDRVEAIVGEALDLAYPKRLGTRPPPSNVGVVVNRVGLARQIYGELLGRVAERGKDAKVYLLTGRTRPIARDRVIGPMIDRIRPAEGGPAEGGPPAFYVATQCIEVGVDVDFDALVTQAAPLDSLRQRFGRLDRVGMRSESDAVIVAATDEIAKKTDDPIYGDRIPKAWAYLNDVATKSTVDFGVLHFPLRDGWDDAIAPRARSATLMPAYVRMWSQTRPRPDPDPDPAIFLHGIGAKAADVQVVWRADVSDAMLGKGSELDLGRAGLTVCSPSQLEAISLPVWTARKWLGGRGARLPLSDLEGSGADGDLGGGDSGTAQSPCALRWRGLKDSRTGPINADQIRPGDTLVVPATRGGCDLYGWDERSDDEVDDLGMDAGLLHRRSLTFRLGGLYLSQVCPAAKNDIEKMSVDLADESADTILDALAGTDGIAETWSRTLKTVRVANLKSARKYGNVVVERSSDEDGQTVIVGVRIDLDKALARKIVAEMYPNHAAVHALMAIEGRRGTPATDEEADGGGDGAEDSKRSLLSDHCRGVARIASEFCKRIGMDQKVGSDITLAAKLHDAGKAERRVQAFLYRKDPDDLGEDDAVIAKSRGGAPGLAEYLQMMQLARLPAGYRHECWSVKMAESHPEFQAAYDCDLVRYMIGTHHGHGRPLFPPVADALADEVVEWTLDGKQMSASSNHGLGRIGSGWVDMCERLYHKYGPWHLAYMEAVVRLADHRQSEKELGVD